MHKKLITACLALIAFAAMAVVPALASASPVLTETTIVEGVHIGTDIVETGKTVQAVNEGESVLDTSAGTVTCSNVLMSGKLATNSGTEIAGNVETASYTGTGTEGKCTSQFLGQVKVDVEALPYCLKAGGKLAADTFEIRGGGCASTAANLKFTLTGALGTCTYKRSAVTGSFTTGGTQAVLTVGASQTFTKESGSSLCPTEGTLTGKYKLQTSDGKPLFVS